eukprot:82770_1
MRIPFIPIRRNEYYSCYQSCRKDLSNRIMNGWEPSSRNIVARIKRDNLVWSRNSGHYFGGLVCRGGLQLGVELDLRWDVVLDSCTGLKNLDIGSCYVEFIQLLACGRLFTAKPATYD